MRLILDLQGFQDENNKFIPKELAAYDGKRISHYVFRRPFALSLLSPELHANALWVMKNHHCIDWCSGYTPLHFFSSIVKDLTKNANYVFVKGSEKAAYIRKYCYNPIIELDEQPKLQLTEPKCFYHSKSPSMCALSNVFYLYEQFIMNE